MHRGAIRRASTPRRKAGEIKNFTGIDAPYEAPENAEIHLHTSGQEAQQLADQVVKVLTDRGIVTAG